jgi:hypothetical protein
MKAGSLPVPYGGRFDRAINPVSFWFFLCVNLFAAVILLCVGAASLYHRVGL